MITTYAGDWDLRGIDLDTLFAMPELSDTCIDAAIRTQARFSGKFPGWFLYRRVVSGCPLYDRQLEAWAVGCARGLARARTLTGHPMIANRVRGGWVAQAGRDALDYAIFGRYPATAHQRGEMFGIRNVTYAKLRDPIAQCMWIGLETFRAELHAEYWRVRRDERSAYS
jgi:hypothetical protein